jgi:hypothetical protein
LPYFRNRDSAVLPYFWNRDSTVLHIFPILGTVAAQCSTPHI